MSDVQERLSGALLGLAWGDVLGCPVEGWRDHEIRDIWGEYRTLPEAYPLARIRERSPKREKRLRPLGLYSDDTQQALALLWVTLQRGGFSASAWGKILVAGAEAGAWRGTGPNFRDAVRALAGGASPKSSGSASAGMGAAMRIPPLGALLRNRRSELIRVAGEASATTHAEVRAIAMAVAVALAAAKLCNGEPAAQVREALPAEVRSIEEEWLAHRKDWRIDRAGGTQVSDALTQLAADPPATITALRERVSELAKPHLREGFTRAHPNQGFVLLGALHALGVALHSPLEPGPALAELVRQGFDTDTAGAIAGGLLGARFGTSWIPEARIRDLPRLRDYAGAMHRQRPPAESAEALLAREAELTAEEKAFVPG